MSQTFKENVSGILGGGGRAKGMLPPPQLSPPTFLAYDRVIVEKRKGICITETFSG